MTETLLSVPERFVFKENSDTVIYFCGTIKNLSENIKILKLMSSKNLEDILIQIIKDLTKYVILFIIENFRLNFFKV